jgi:hypothetical protein
MQVRCPHCGALLHSGETPSDGQSPKKCWMCSSTVTPNAGVPEPGPPTIVLPTEPPARWSAARLGRDSASETKSLELPRGLVIKICVVAGSSQGVEFELSRPLMTIGRLGGEADIQIDDPGVSRLHCALEVRRDAILLHDLRSSNGTFVDGSLVFAARLKRMSQFRIGSSHLQVNILSSTNQASKL